MPNHQASPFSVKATQNLINIAAVNQRKVQATSDLENIGLYQWRRTSMARYGHCHTLFFDKYTTYLSIYIIFFIL
jgi:hypothetical protein